MLSVLLWALVLSFACVSFSYTYTLCGINRAFLGIYKAIPESNVVAYASNGAFIDPYFVVDSLKDKTQVYFENSLHKYTSNWNCSFYFADVANKEIEVEEKPTYVEIGLTVYLTSTTFHRSASFFVKEGLHGGN